MKKLRNTFSISRFADRLECAIARFPLTILACIALTLTIPSVNEEKGNLSWTWSEVINY